MNKIFSFFLLPAAAMVVSAACANRSSSTLDFVKDECDVVTRINPQEKSVYLIFTGHHSQDDDGYFENFDGAEFVLNTLNEHGIKGSFFPTGVCFEVEKYKPVLRNIVAGGHYLSGHSYAHLYLCSDGDPKENLVTLDSIANDNVKLERVLQEVGLAKEQYLWLVPPYEHYNPFSADAYRSLGYKLANPTPGLVTSMDWMGKDDPAYHSAVRMIQNIWDFEKEHTLNGAIILIHAMDYPIRTHEDRPYRYLGEIITRLKEMGYGFKSFWDVIAQENQLKK